MKNGEGYNDPTVGGAMANISRKEWEKEQNVKNDITSLMYIFKQAASLVWLEIVGRITFRDRHTGKEYR